MHPASPHPQAPGSTNEAALELLGIDKRFGSVHANRSINLSVAKGSIHGLVGENGAGKSTLMNIVYGFHQADSGEIRVNGRKVHIARPRDSISAGIGMVHQHFMLVDRFTVLENVVLGAERGGTLRGGLDHARESLARLGRDYGLEVPLYEETGHLPVGMQQRVEILKALHHGAQILILDEPTAVLTPSEADQLFRMLAQLRDQGKTVILVTHKLREIMAITDRVTVMRQGAVIHETATKETSPRALAEQMVGRSVLLRVDKTPAKPGAPLLELRGVSVKDRFGVERLKNASLTLRAGEIIGVAGVSGNGQSELLEAIAGTRAVSAGQILLKGQDITHDDHAARDRRGKGIAHVPEDRLRNGVVASYSAEDNSVLGYEAREKFSRYGFLRRKVIRADCERRMAEFDVRPPLPAQRITAFSGGNQQKLVIAREIDCDPDVLVVGQPTRGVDIGAIEFIHKRIIAMRDAGKAVLVVSVELDEIMGLSDRILVMAGGEIVGELDAASATEEAIGLLMAGERGGKHA
jgi:general nucleoside transport system ATP-binding protein